jgi:hypothetical protein
MDIKSLLRWSTRPMSWGNWPGAVPRELSRTRTRLGIRSDAEANTYESSRSTT